MSRQYFAGAGVSFDTAAPAMSNDILNVPLPHEIPPDARIRSYQTTYDPQLDPAHRGNEMHRRYELDVRQITTDPRVAPGVNQKKPRRRARQQLEQCTFVFDKNSVGPPPPRELVIHGLSPLTTPAVILQQCRAFGRVEASELKVDPQTGESIGIFWLRYTSDDGHEMAKTARHAISGSRVGPSVVTAILDTEKEHYVRMYRTELGKRYPPKAVLDARKAEARKAEARKVDEKREEARCATVAQRSEPRQRSRWDVGSTREAASRAVFYGKRDTGPRMSEQTAGIHERLASLSHSYVFVPYVPVNDSAVLERFRAFTPVLFERGDGGWYIGFKEEVAAKCQRVLNGVRINGQTLRLDVHTPQRATRSEVQKPQPQKTHWTLEELQAEVVHKLLSELEALFLRDVKNRVVAPRIAAFLRSEGTGGRKLAEHRERQERNVRPAVVGALPSFSKMALDPIPRVPGAPPAVPRKPKRVSIDYSDDSEDEEVPDVRASGIVQDEEDAYLLKLALERESRGEPLPPFEDGSDDDDMAHVSGCARAEGFYRIPASRKAAHLPDRNRAVVGTTVSSLASARNNRADSRRLALDIEQHKRETLTDTDILKFNQLRTRKKQLRFAKSPIHDWGLYAMEVIPPGDMVIEYVGEIVRQQVADHREKMYERAVSPTSNPG